MCIRDSGKSYVMARGENGKLEQRWVQTGKVVWASYTQIRGGLTQEDYVACLLYTSRLSRRT